MPPVTTIMRNNFPKRVTKAEIKLLFLATLLYNKQSQLSKHNLTFPQCSNDKCVPPVAAICRHYDMLDKNCSSDSSLYPVWVRSGQVRLDWCNTLTSNHYLMPSLIVSHKTKHFASSTVVCLLLNYMVNYFIYRPSTHQYCNNWSYANNKCCQPQQQRRQSTGFEYFNDSLYWLACINAAGILQNTSNTLCVITSSSTSHTAK